MCHSLPHEHKHIQQLTPQQNAELQTLLGRGSDYETVRRQLDGMEGSLEALRSQVYKPFPNLQALINIVQASFEKEQFNRYVSLSLSLVPAVINHDDSSHSDLLLHLKLHATYAS